MLELVPLEKLLFLGILFLSVISSILAYVQIVKEDVRFRHSLVAFALLQITLAVVLLIFRSHAIQAFPMTGVFESMLVLMVLIGITFLFLSAFIQQIWFSSVMVWVLSVLALLSALVAKPAAAPQEAARTPWAVAHALSMSLAGAMIIFAGAMSILFLWSRRCLKKNQFVKLFGTMPTLEKLQALNLLGLRLGFVAMTFGLVSGIGLVAISSQELGLPPADWLTDSKIVLVAVSWTLLLCILLLRRVFAFSGKAVAQATLVICFLILFAFIGSEKFCKSGHGLINQPGRPSSSSQAL
ncbi:MAG: cytochrome c biogenesis protein CcsA [Planctomycetes bacterium]|nr:cytochrome c biogenesis protein CcsA [Planctomycetota bacterium]